ncbi:hypothetical protein [Kitasatospora sp. McL0602]|uniref:hypothetical protein n=1 Tax=Kitasatospora sp. McL0602 TaxID=3439530 RepID=UPI003F8882FA
MLAAGLEDQGDGWQAFAAGGRVGGGPQAQVAVCAIAAALPSCVLGDLERELTLLAGGLVRATEAGRAATAAGDARVLPVRRPPMLGSDHGDLLDRLAYRRAFDSAAESFEIALHHQGDRDEQACAQALHNALAAGSGVAAAALLRVADDPALGLGLDRWEHLHRIATELSLRVVEDLGGANGDGTTTADDRPAGPAAG